MSHTAGVAIEPRQPPPEDPPWLELLGFSGLLGLLGLLGFSELPGLLEFSELPGLLGLLGLLGFCWDWSTTLKPHTVQV